MLGKRLPLILLTFVLLVPTVALAGGDFDDAQQQQQWMPQVNINLPDDDDGLSNEVLAALVAGGLGLCGILVKAYLSRKS